MLYINDLLTEENNLQRVCLCVVCMGVYGCVCLDVNICSACECVHGLTRCVRVYKLLCKADETTVIKDNSYNLPTNTALLYAH